MKAGHLFGVAVILIVIVLLLLGTAYVSEGKPLTDHTSSTGTATMEPVMQMIETASAQETQAAQQAPYP